jgi:hypothetical protein
LAVLAAVSLEAAEFICDCADGDFFRSYKPGRHNLIKHHVGVEDEDHIPFRNDPSFALENLSKRPDMAAQLQRRHADYY